MLTMSMASMLGVRKLSKEFHILTHIHLFSDYAAGEFIVREAGGYTCDPAGGALDLMSRRVLCAASKELADEIVPHLTQFYPQPRDD